MKLFKVLRNNWKKSLFAISTLSYGTFYLIERKHNADLLQAYCYEALKYSRDKINPEHCLKRVTIFLNPVSNKEHGRFAYDKNVAPLLNLSGLDVRLVRLDKKTEASDYMKELDVSDTDCIVIAGGNATINECITSLMNRPDSSQFLQRIPIGIIPIGATNTFANKWFMQLGLAKTKESEIRLLADSAMSIIKGVAVPVDLIKVTLNHKKFDKENNDELVEDLKNRGAFNLLKQDKLYAFSNVSAGFVTETDAYIDNFWFYGWLKEHMNNYVLKRYLNRQPLAFNIFFKYKCNGCSSCLNQSELRTKLDRLTNKKYLNIQHSSESGSKNLSILQRVYKKFVKSDIFTPIETPLMNENRKKQIKNYEKLIEKSKIANEECNKIHKAKFKQAQIISNINQPEVIDLEQSNGLETVIIKDPQYNINDMFLAQKRNLQEFNLEKIVSDNKKLKLSKLENFLKALLAIEIDGEIYKIKNEPENELNIQVEHIEKCINLLRCDSKLSNSIQVNYWPKIYLNRLSSESDDIKNQKPSIRPFEEYYVKYFKTDDESRDKSTII